MHYDAEELADRAYEDEMDRLEAERLMEESREQARRDFEARKHRGRG